jgi:hypothetical protein
LISALEKNVCDAIPKLLEIFDSDGWLNIFTGTFHLTQLLIQNRKCWHSVLKIAFHDQPVFDVNMDFRDEMLFISAMNSNTL